MGVEGASVLTDNLQLQDRQTLRKSVTYHPRMTSLAIFVGGFTPYPYKP